MNNITSQYISTDMYYVRYIAEGVMQIMPTLQADTAEVKHMEKAALKKNRLVAQITFQNKFKILC